MLLFLTIMALTGCQTTQDLPEEVPTTMLNQQLQTDDYILIDVRTSEEINEFRVNHPNYKALDFYGDSFEQRLLELDKDETYIIMCNSGRRSAITQEIMNKHGYTTTNVAGGIQDWMQQGFPTIESSNMCF